MLDRTEEFIDKVINDQLFLMNSVHRQSTMMTIKAENIAQHSFFVAYYALKISKLLKLSEEKQSKIAVQALVHDIPESLSSDIPSNIKHKVNELKETLDKIEDTIIDEYFQEIKNEFSTFKKNEEEKNLEGTIIKLADVISLIQFLNNEIVLGNSDKNVQQAIERARNKIENCLKRLSELGVDDID